MSGNDLMKKGILTDLYLLMEEDPQMQPEMFLEMVWNLMEYDGKLYVLPEYVCLQALVLDKKLLEEKKLDLSTISTELSTILLKNFGGYFLQLSTIL